MELSIINIGNSKGIRPVSYTHLDVYKRQEFTFSFTNEAEDIKPVSYTHLDVYKRQLMELTNKNVN